MCCCLMWGMLLSDVGHAVIGCGACCDLMWGVLLPDVGRAVI